jgi:2-oxoglutarate dehydrogenase E1 component
MLDVTLCLSSRFSLECAYVETSNRVSPLDLVTGMNSLAIDELYERYRQDKNSVDPQWAYFFAGFELAGRNGRGTSAATAPAEPPQPEESQPTAAISSPDLQIADLIHNYRELGHLIADLDPLGHNMTQHAFLDLAEFGLSEADLDRTVKPGNFRGPNCGTLRQLIQGLRSTYCGTFAVEYMDIRDPEQRTWLQEQMEPTLNKPALSKDDRKRILSRLVAAEDFELFLHKKFSTVKRFSNEGGDTLITLLDETVDFGSELGMDEMLIGMAHRGRLNVLTHILRKPYEMLLTEVKGRPTARAGGDGDVKYHLGYAHELITSKGKSVHLSMAANPSHLELIDPIIEGITRAKQNRKGDVLRDRTIPVLIHGDAAFTGQGIVAETLYLSELEAYRTGGTIHIIVNNQIGFTTNPSDGRFTRYPSDVAKAIQAPVFHVNADDPEACVHAARLAMAFRQHFKADVIIDLVCYRRRGHNEMDDASVTQPVMAREIAAHPTARQLYAKRLLAAGIVAQPEVDAMAKEIEAKLESALAYADSFKPSETPPPVHGPWKDFVKVTKDWSAKTGVDKVVLKDIARKCCTAPEGFNVHKTVARMYEQRLSSVESEAGINWGCGEMLAIGSLLNEGTWVRLTGQDVCRGTFSHRNAVLFDSQTGRPYVPLAQMAEGKSRFMIINTMLSELAVVGFEYGFASADPQALIMWEAQFGDFVNMCQPIIDQFISSAESKWGKFNGLVMLLPHGYEGQGPEHSHARLERFLQLAAEDNLQVCYPSTPAQYFHMLRRQIHRTYRRPLIVMSPKSMLRNPLAVSKLDDFAHGGFQDLLDEADPTIERSRVRRVLICSGKIYYELLAERIKQKITDVAIVRLEQIYPFPADRLTEISKTYRNEAEICWVQEEPRNNGVYPFIGAKLHYHWVGMKKLTYIGRKPSASPAAGSHEQHVAEQTEIINKALGIVQRPPTLAREGKAVDGPVIRHDIPMVAVKETK